MCLTTFGFRIISFYCALINPQPYMENESTPQPEQTELYRDLKEMLYEEPASVGQRFLNYVIDIILFYAMFAVFGMLAAMVGLATGSENPESNFFTESSVNPLLDLLITWLVFVLFYTFFEAVTKGRTVGKMITRTKAVKDDESEITPREAVLRSLCRLVPFEPFSAFGGHPWHDKWTGTKVIKKRR